MTKLYVAKFDTTLTSGAAALSDLDQFGIRSEGRLFVGGCLPRHWDREPLGALPGLPEWGRRRRRARPFPSPDPGPQPAPASAPDYDPCPVIPKADRKTQESLRHLEWNNVYQNGYGACCVCAHCNAIEFWLTKTGRAKTKLDWYKAYMELTGGRGGVVISTMTIYAMQKGIPLVDGSGRLRITEAFDIGSLDALVSALQMGDHVIFGHDSHAEAAMSEIVDEHGNEFLDTRNTWDVTWGDKGWHTYPLTEVELESYGATGIREVELRPIDIADVPVQG